MYIKYLLKQEAKEVKKRPKNCLLSVLGVHKKVGEGVKNLPTYNVHSHGILVCVRDTGLVEIL